MVRLRSPHSPREIGRISARRRHSHLQTEMLPDRTPQLVNRKGSMVSMDQTRSVLSAEGLDGIAKALAATAEPRQRASVICGVVREIFETVQWLHEPGVADDELLSLSRLLIEALKHGERMAGLNPETNCDNTTQAEDLNMQWAS
jgi:hypothetical protein